jgi:hypothetical protein
VPGAATSGDFDVELRYNRCEWTTGDASGGDSGLGGTPASAGYDAASKIGAPVFSTLPGSGTASVLDLCTTSNVDSAGVWVLHVRGGVVALCGNEIQIGRASCRERVS